MTTCTNQVRDHDCLRGHGECRRWLQSCSAGTNHGLFGHLIAVVEREKPDAIVLLGDIEASRPLHIELTPIIGKTKIHIIPGNHDTDEDFYWRNLVDSKFASGNLSGRVDTVAGIRIAGLGGIFRKKVWMPPAAPAFDSYAAWLKDNKPRHGEIDVAKATEVSTHQTTICPDVYARLSKLKADVLVTHEAPSVHPHGVLAIDELARAMRVQATFHGHHHDARNYQVDWDRLGFQAYGVGFCGMTNIDGTIVRPGDFDDQEVPC